MIQFGIFFLISARFMDQNFGNILFFLTNPRDNLAMSIQTQAEQDARKNLEEREEQKRNDVVTSVTFHFEGWHKGGFTSVTLHFEGWHKGGLHCFYGYPNEFLCDVAE
jgi:hypothetical protein